jgi:hypothetical protein
MLTQATFQKYLDHGSIKRKLFVLLVMTYNQTKISQNYLLCLKSSVNNFFSSMKMNFCQKKNILLLSYFLLMR